MQEQVDRADNIIINLHRMKIQNNLKHLPPNFKTIATRALQDRSNALRLMEDDDYLLASYDNDVQPTASTSTSSPRASTSASASGAGESANSSGVGATNTKSTPKKGK